MKRSPSTWWLLSAALLASPALASPVPVGPPAPASLERERRALIPADAAAAGQPRGGEAANSESTPIRAVPGGWSDTAAMMGPLALVVGLIVLAAHVLRRAAGSASGSLAAALGPGGQAPPGLLDVLGRYPIARGQMLVLLRVDRRVLLLGHTLPSRGVAGGFSTLAEISDPDEVAALLLKARDARGESAANQFADVIARMERGDLGEREIDQQRRVTVSRAPGRGGADSVHLWREDPTAIPPFSAGSPADAAGSLRGKLAALRGRASGHGGVGATMSERGSGGGHGGAGA
jgi:flagellar biogenesis protein FliO